MNLIPFLIRLGGSGKGSFEWIAGPLLLLVFLYECLIRKNSDKWSVRFLFLYSLLCFIKYLTLFESFDTANIRTWAFGAQIFGAVFMIPYALFLWGEKFK